MVKVRKYSRKRVQPKKMKGGVDTPTPPLLNVSDLNVSDLNVSDLNVSDINENLQQGEQQGWVNPDYSGNTTFQSDISDGEPFAIGQQNVNLPFFEDIEEIPLEENFDLPDDENDLNLSLDNSENTTMETNDSIISMGGKKRTKRSKKKIKKSKKKPKKKSNKTRKNVKKRQRGGDNMDIEYLNPNDRDKKDYDQMINSLNWTPKQ